ncbi:spore germination protein GerPC [Paenibacillus sp. CCS19]|uniref:spore germination protein GerPC n=1 Tax=Paenibacillus sp. CCS19 TaxID=3158387 RepID=UPI00295F56C3|nr:spore germination protein GerPC [Paenibacillus cellulosilyticus]
MAVTNNNDIPYGQPAASAAERSASTGWPGWPAWISRVEQTLRHQHEQIAMLQKRIDMLMAQVQAAEAKPTYHIDKIEYQFDQLKIEKLDGTLNIGIQPSGDGSESDIDQFIVQQAKKGAAGPNGVTGAGGNGNGESGAPGALNSKPNVFPSAGPASMQMPPPFGDVQTRVNSYLDNNAPTALVSFEQELNVPLDPYHRRIIIEDIRRQAPTRIQFYMQQAAQSADIADANSAQLEDQVTAKTIRDVDMAMRQYLTKLSSGGETAGGVITV